MNQVISGSCGYLVVLSCQSFKNMAHRLRRKTIHLKYPIVICFKGPDMNYSQKINFKIDYIFENSSI